MYGIEIKVSGAWRAVCPPSGGPPYSFGSKPEAETMARVLYPAMASNPALLRIKEV